MNRLRLALVTCGFLGLAPVAPGTFGTLGGVALAWLASRSGAYLAWTIAACVVLYALGAALGPWAERRAGGKDPGFFVLDEVVGYLIVVAWTAAPSSLALVVGFFLFRLFDITKPWPARNLERMGGGHGIMLDDVMAGIYGLLVMAIARWARPDAHWTIGA
jgi:phosphatidylglycerophosphatase A